MYSEEVPAQVCPPLDNSQELCFMESVHTLLALISGKPLVVPAS